MRKGFREAPDGLFARETDAIAVPKELLPIVQRAKEMGYIIDGDAKTGMSLDDTDTALKQQYSGGAFVEARRSGGNVRLYCTVVGEEQKLFVRNMDVERGAYRDLA